MTKLVAPRLSVVPLKIGNNNCKPGKRTGKRRLFEKSQHFTGRILLRTGTNTQEGDYLIPDGLVRTHPFSSKVATGPKSAYDETASRLRNHSNSGSNYFYKAQRDVHELGRPHFD